MKERGRWGRLYINLPTTIRDERARYYSQQENNNNGDNDNKDNNNKGNDNEGNDNDDYTSICQPASEMRGQDIIHSKLLSVEQCNFDKSLTA